MAIRASTESKLLDAADELFFSRGIAATPIDAVIELAGVSAATLYRGYPSKEALLAAALERRHREWLEMWDSAIAAQDSDEGRLLAVFDALDSFRTRPLGSRWCAFLGSAAEYVDPPAEVERAIRRDTETMRARLAQFAAAVDARRSSELADQLLLLVTGDLAMRLRSPDHSSHTARSIAATLVASR
jgi:AcrR family transcriptional regulator